MTISQALRKYPRELSGPLALLTRSNENAAADRSAMTPRGSGTSHLPLLDSRVPWAIRQLCYVARSLPYYGRSLPLLASLTPSLQGAVIETEPCGAICIDLRERVCIPLFVHGCYRHQTPQDYVLDCLLHSGMKVFDIGANIGYYTAFISRRVRENGLVVAIEPTNRANRLLKRTSQVCAGNTVILQAAVGATSGFAKFYEQRSLDTSFVQYGKSGDSSSIEVRTVDELSSEYGNPGLIKIDIEGAEIHALEGATKTLSGVDPPLVMIEYIASNAARFGAYTLEELLRYFPTDSFLTYRIVAPGRLRSVGGNAEDATNDFLAVPRGKQSAIAALLSN
jgi:FkbM family methyltransferase